MVTLPTVRAMAGARALVQLFLLLPQPYRWYRSQSTASLERWASQRPQPIMPMPRLTFSQWTMMTSAHARPVRSAAGRKGRPKRMEDRKSLREMTPAELQAWLSHQQGELEEFATFAQA